ncbi:telomeric repeat-binding factor 2-interacting protein 1 [Genypterus blacodes]|uniref:telomeric repeat-binding factor 2-interacting protein 1 n=1 Tax=Genypterus blacodes TaxID=154954 RepID=UPI003F768769
MKSTKTPEEKPHKISPVLFMTEDGEPMSFYVRPCSAKSYLNCYIKAGGGVLSNVQKPGTILLIDPEESYAIPENTVLSYVSINYVRDCVKQNVQLDLDQYRLQSEEKKTENRASSSGGGRMPFTPEEDDAVLKYIGKHNVVFKLKGNVVWQQMEKAGVTKHSWQSMKARFKKFLFEKEVAAQQQAKEDTNQEAAVEKPSCDEDAAPPQEDSSATDQTQIEAQLTEDESVQTKIEDTQVSITTLQQASPKEAPAAQDESVPEVPTSEKPKPPEPVQRPRRSTRRQLDLEDPRPPSPRRTRTKKSAVGTPSETTDQPSPKRAKGQQGAEESNQESGQDTPMEMTPADEESHSVPQKEGKKKEKRKLGILEMAAKEFEDDSESCEDETTEPENPAVLETRAPLTENQGPTSDAAAEDAPPSSDPEKGPEAQASTSNHLPETSTPNPAVAEPLPSSKAHLFIFDSESQEGESQSVLGDGAAAPLIPPPPLAEDVELEKDTKRIRDLMTRTKQDLVCVTKALLKTSGDFSAALGLLLDASGFSGPLWSSHDDALLRSGDPAVRQQLQEKYGEANTAKRIVFLEAEG